MVAAALRRASAHDPAGGDRLLCCVRSTIGPCLLLSLLHAGDALGDAALQRLRWRTVVDFQVTLPAHRVDADPA
jgi:hypothetical protein